MGSARNCHEQCSIWSCLLLALIWTNEQCCATLGPAANINLTTIAIKGSLLKEGDDSVSVLIQSLRHDHSDIIVRIDLSNILQHVVIFINSRSYIDIDPKPLWLDSDGFDCLDWLWYSQSLWWVRSILKIKATWTCISSSWEVFRRYLYMYVSVTAFNY